MRSRETKEELFLKDPFDKAAFCVEPTCLFLAFRPCISKYVCVGGQSEGSDINHSVTVQLNPTTLHKWQNGAPSEILGKSNNSLSPDGKSSVFHADLQVAVTEPDINNRLESLCLSMTEHALGDGVDRTSTI
ncbi:hypothetical protein GN956_G26016 [Arapaima gigas]